MRNVELSAKLVYQQIKKLKGERFAKAIRDFDDGIFAIPNLIELLRYAGDDPKPYLNFLRTFKTVKESVASTDENPFLLLEKAGYHAFEADTLEKQDSIRPYFARGEELCTFGTRRFQDYYIINAVKKGAEKLNRNLFVTPERQDEYGTSVISIQILKSGGFISIKNRYNHAVDFCDNTFNSNPDEIILGLSSALKKHFNVDFEAKGVEIVGNYTYQNGMIVKYNFERNNIYFGDGFYVENGRAFEINKDYQLMIDDMILDLREKKIYPICYSSDALFEVLEKELRDKTLQVKKRGDTRVLFADGKEVLTVQNSCLTKLSLTVKELPLGFLLNHKTIKEVDVPFVNKIGPVSFNHCPNLERVNIGNFVGKFGDDIFCGVSAKVEAKRLNELGVMFFGSVAISVPQKKILSVGNLNPDLVDYLNGQLRLDKENPFQIRTIKEEGKTIFYFGKHSQIVFQNQRLVGLILKEAEYIPYGMIVGLKDLEFFDAPNAKAVCGRNFSNCPNLKKIRLASVEDMEFNSVINCPNLTTFFAPNLRHTEGYDFNDLPKLKELDVRSLECMGEHNFVNTGINRLDMPFLVRIRQNSVRDNPCLKEISMPDLSWSQEGCFCNLPKLETINLPELYHTWGNEYLSCNPNLKRVILPRLETVRSRMFLNCPRLQEIYLPEATLLNDHAIAHLPELKKLYAPRLRTIDDFGLIDCPKLTDLTIANDCDFGFDVGKRVPAFKEDETGSFVPAYAKKVSVHSNLTNSKWKNRRAFASYEREI